MFAKSMFFAMSILSLKGRWIEFGNKAALWLPSGIAWVYKGNSEFSNCSWLVWQSEGYVVKHMKYDDDGSFILDYEQAKQRAATALLGARKR